MSSNLSGTVSKNRVGELCPKTLSVNFFRFLLEEPHLGDPKHNCYIPKPDEQILYMLSLLPTEDIDIYFVSGNQVLYLPLYTCC